MRLHLVLAVALYCACAPVALAHEFRYTANLTGPAESPANNSPGIGHAVITLDLDLVTMDVAVEFSDLEGTVTQAHIHAPTAAVGSGTAGVATQVPSFSGFPTGVTSGSYDNEFDLTQASSYNPAFIASSGGTVSDALNALVNALNQGRAYLNIHTSDFGGGEIRGFLSYVPGDFNDDGVVDAADYVVWRDTEGDVGDGLAADFNNDSVVDEFDYAIWRQNFGAHGLSAGAGSGAGLAASIPEPCTLTLVLAFWYLLQLVRRSIGH